MKRFLVAILAVAFNLFPSVRDAAAQSAAGKAELSGLATVSGTVTSAVPFQAAKVYFRNADRRMQYMVYTAGGNYQALHLLPGKYEMRVEARGLDSEVTQVVLNPGSNPPQNVVLRPVQSTGAQIVSMSEMFPAGSGQRPLREVCVGCHSPDFFGARHYPEAAWASYIEMMLKGGQVAAGFLSEQDRLELAQYLGKNFGPESRRRTVRYDRQVPLDEAKLAKAMYVEYYLKPNDDPKLRRRGQDPHFDQQGNVWITDRNVPNRLSRLDPRTGEWKDWPMPHPDGETHGLTIDKDGIVWVPERMGKRKDNDGLHLAAFDPKTETWETLPDRPRAQDQGAAAVAHPGRRLPGQRLGHHDRRRPLLQVGPRQAHGADVRNADTAFRTLWHRRRQPGQHLDGAVPRRRARGQVRRQVGQVLGVQGAHPARENAARERRHGRPRLVRRLRPGILGYIDPKSGTATEFKVPLDISRPYDPQADYEGNVWFGDDGQGGLPLASTSGRGSSPTSRRRRWRTSRRSRSRAMARCGTARDRGPSRESACSIRMSRS
jgi:hypothetical protein